MDADLYRHPPHMREQIQAHRVVLSAAADRLAPALRDHDIPNVLEELRNLQPVLGRYAHGQHPNVAGAVDEAIRSTPVAARVEIAEALLVDCEGRDRCDPLLFLAQHSLYSLTVDLTPADLQPVAEHWFGFIARHNEYVIWEPLVGLIQEYRARGGTVPVGVVSVIRRNALANMDYNHTGGLDELAASLTEPPLNPGEAWADLVNAELETLAAADGAVPGPWRRLLAHAATASTARPSRPWEKTARALLAEIGAQPARDRLIAWLAPVGRPRTVSVLFPVWPARDNHPDTTADEYDPCNIDTLRGLTWMLGFAPSSADSARTLGHLVETSLRKLPGKGQRCVRVANAAVYALLRQHGDAALAELARLSIAVTYKGTLKEITKALQAKATGRGLTTAEVEEIAIPSHGLTELGRRIETFGDFRAELTVVGTSVVWTWHAAGGRVVKSVPAKVRGEYGPELKELKADAAEIAKTLSAHSERLDRQFLMRRSWRYDVWRARLADHLVLGTLVRRLIWLVDGTPVFFDGLGADDVLRTVDGAVVMPAPDARVELWHPVGRDLEEVLAWRLRLEEAGVTQPFKQAHREVYLLTPAEERTNTYSNRFAAQIVRQHQFQALASLRGWHSKLRLAVDDWFPPAVKQLPHWLLRAEFWIDGVGGEGWDAGEVTASGAYLYLATDQVRFYRNSAAENSAHAGSGEFRPGFGVAPGEPIPLAEIPPLVLSEVLRDADLFVGVAGVGNDPAWSDGGPAGRYRDYWEGYAFGELGVSAQNRADLLVRLVPRLAIADRCRIDGRFLEVRGKLNTYKIHLGSGNILMEPGGRYLCIVPSRGSADADSRVALPFEGDRTLAVILSKALMLAEDTAITDPTIVQQLGGGA